jgi:hypothetical protein
MPAFTGSRETSLASATEPSLSVEQGAENRVYVSNAHPARRGAQGSVQPIKHPRHRLSSKWMVHPEDRSLVVIGLSCIIVADVDRRVFPAQPTRIPLSCRGQLRVVFDAHDPTNTSVRGNDDRTPKTAPDVEEDIFMAEPQGGKEIEQGEVVGGNVSVLISVFGSDG